MSTIKAEVKLIRIEEIVLMKILKHANSIQDEADSVIGKLLGYYDESNEVIEIGTAYPLPKANQDEQNDYLQEMSKRLDLVNVDNLDVGWYQVSYKQNHLITTGSFEAQREYQIQNPHGIYLVYDVLEAKNGGKMPFYAYRLNEQFGELSKKSKTNQSELKKYTTQYDHIFIPIQIEISRSPLTQAFINAYGSDIKENYAKKQLMHPTFDYGYEFVKNSEYLIEAVQDISEENQKNIIQRQDQIQKKQQDIQINPQKFIDTTFLFDRVKNISSLINHQSQINQSSQKVIDALKQQ